MTASNLGLRSTMPGNVLNPDCPSRQLIKLLSEKWVMLIVNALRDEKKRTSQLKHILRPVSQKMLTQQLRKLERHNIVKRTVYDQVPPKVEYELTELGQSLVEPVLAVCHWAETNFADTLDAERED